MEPESFNLDIGQLDQVLAAHPSIKAILPVHLYGGCADMGPFLDRAAARGIPVIEDAAQAVGAEWRGARAGSIGTIGCFSFFPTKNLGGFGDGGMLTTQDDKLARDLRALRVHGSFEKYVHQWPGMNSRLDALQAAVLNVKLDSSRRVESRAPAQRRAYRETLGDVVATPAPRAASDQPRVQSIRHSLRAARRIARLAVGAWRRNRNLLSCPVASSARARPATGTKPAISR